MYDCIERESAIEAIMSEPPDAHYPQWYAEKIKSIPAADVAPVVRCRDCKHAWIHPCGYVYCHRDGRNAYEMTFNLDSFCSYGERKEGADNG